MTTDREKALLEIKAKLNLPKPGKEGIGLGDVVHKVTDLLGMDHCDECEKRRQRMNRWLRFTAAEDKEKDK